MANDRYVSGVFNFSDVDYYAASEAGDFNPITQQFGAFALFFLLGQYQNAGIAGGPPDPGVIWGNYDVANDLGWQFTIEPNAGTGQPNIVVTLGDGSPNKFIADLATGAGGGVGGFAERLILAEFWQDATSFVMAINGTIVTQTAGGLFHPAAVAVSPSSFAPRIGVGTAGEDPLISLVVVAAGYNGSRAGDMSIGDLIGAHFNEARASLSGAHITRSQLNGGVDLDWDHRYEASALQGVTYRINQSTRSTNIVLPFPAPPTTWPDSGNSGFTDNPITPAPLTVASSGSLPTFMGRKNPDWWAGPSTTVFKVDGPI